MSVKGSIQKYVRKAFLKLGDAVVSMTYTKVSSTYASSTVTGTTVAYPFKGVITEYKDHQMGGLIQAGDRMIAVEGEGLKFAPVADGLIAFGTQSWKVIEPGPVYAGDEVALYEIQVRR